MTKKELRIKYKLLREKLTELFIEENSLKIANMLLKLNIWDKTYYHLFLTIVEYKEVNTEFILHTLASKDKKITISSSDFTTRKMTHYLLDDHTKIKKSRYNIPEPINGVKIDSNKIEVVFIPLLAFDKKGNRVGYGKGFYDLFLSTCNSNTVKIGISFFEAEEQIENISENDIQLNFCITPQTIYHF